MDRKETDGLMKKEPRTHFSEQGWPEEWRGERHKREKGRDSLRYH